MRLAATTLRCLGAGLLVVASVYMFAIKAAWARPYPALLAWSALVVCVWLVAELVWAVVQRIKGGVGNLAFAARAGLALGTLLVLAGGLANWAFSLQGFVLMAEGDAAPFFHGRHLQAFVSGPLSNVDEMDLVLYLDRIKLRYASDGELEPVSHLRLVREGEEPHDFTLSPDRSVEDGTLRFHQGMFGYAPRIVILQGDDELFDQVVPFTTRRDDESGRIVFTGEFIVSKYDIDARGEVALDSLDPLLRGHPQLVLSIVRKGQELGAGRLTLGHFADLADGHRVGFAGLKKWAEIAISRKHYPQPMLVGAAITALGLVALFAALAARIWRRSWGRSNA